MSTHPRHRVRDALGQLRHPREFRVPPPFLDAAQTGWLADVLAEAEAAQAAAAEAAKVLATTPTDGTPTTGTPTADGPADAAPGAGAIAPGAGTDALLGAATGIWRALRKLDRGPAALSAADVRQVRRQVLASRQALADDGLEIQEHDGLPFDSGLSLEVLVFQEEPGLTREVVLETVRPSVYLRGERIQMGQVIVGRPAPEQTPGT